MKHQFDPVEDKYVYSLHHCGFQSVSIITKFAITNIYVCMCTVLACTVCTLHNLLSRVAMYTYSVIFSISACACC